MSDFKYFKWWSENRNIDYSIYKEMEEYFTNNY